MSEVERIMREQEARIAELQAEVKDLRAFVLEIAADITAPDISDIREDYNSAILKVFALIEQYNITAESE